VQWHLLQGMHCPGAWVHRVVFKLANSLFRRVAAGRQARHGHGAGDAVNAMPDVAAVHELRQAVLDLPARTRAAIVLQYFADMTVGLAAAVMGCAEGTVRSVTHKGPAALRLQPDFAVEEVTGA
jgi:DNA-directed RNA polymerase specialized sigma24 family protein